MHVCVCPREGATTFSLHLRVYIYIGAWRGGVEGDGGAEEACTRPICIYIVYTLSHSPYCYVEQKVEAASSS